MAIPPPPLEGQTRNDCANGLPILSLPLHFMIIPNGFVVLVFISKT